MPKVRLLPSESRRRGLPAIGFDLVLADGIAIDPPRDGVEVVLAERRKDGRLIGTLSLEIVAAGLIIDRDGTLAQLACRRAPIAGPRPITLDAGAAGYRVDIVRGDCPELPYQSWLALAPRDVGGSGAVIVGIRTLAPGWPAGETMLATLRVFCRDSDARAASSTSGDALLLPLVKRNDG